MKQYWRWHFVQICYLSIDIGTFVYTKRCQLDPPKWQTIDTALPVFISRSPSVSLIPYGWRSGSFNPRFDEVQLKLPPIVGQWWSNDFFSTIYITSVNKKKKTAPFTTLKSWQFIQTADNPSNVYPTGLLFWPSAN